MTPIDDFELLFDPSDSRFRTDGEVPSDIVDWPPPSRWLRKFYVDGFLDLQPWYLSFLYKGARVNHLLISGSRIFAQFRTNAGYVVFAGSEGWHQPEPSTLSGKTKVRIYYILEDLSGTDFGDFYYRWAPIMDTENISGDRLPREANPVAETVIVDDARLDFRLRELGWYRLTLFEDRPRPFAISNWRFNRENTPIWVPRYFHVRRHWPRTVAQKTELSEPVSV